MRNPVTVSYYVCVQGMTPELIHQLRRELEQLLMAYQEKDHDVTITMVYY